MAMAQNGQQVIPMASTVNVDTSYLSGRLMLTGNVPQFNLANGTYAGQLYALKVCEDATGGWTIGGTTTNYTGPTTFPTTANSCTRFLDTWDGTVWTGVIVGTSTAGLPGPPGPQGIQGLTGATGPTGAAGAIGPIGQTGNTGAVGATGGQGVAGAAGSAGVAGSQGIQGQVGPSGANGAVGATGPAGLTYYLNGTLVSSPVKCNHMTGTTTAAGTYVFNYAGMGFTALVGQPQPSIQGTGTNSYIVNIQGTPTVTSTTVYGAQSSIVSVVGINVSLLGWPLPLR